MSRRCMVIGATGRRSVPAPKWRLGKVIEVGRRREDKERHPGRAPNKVEIMMSVLLTIDQIWSDRVLEHVARPN